MIKTRFSKKVTALFWYICIWSRNPLGCPCARGGFRPASHQRPWPHLALKPISHRYTRPEPSANSTKRARRRALLRIITVMQRSYWPPLSVGHRHEPFKLPQNTTTYNNCGGFGTIALTNFQNIIKILNFYPTINGGLFVQG